jgi:hypothetical protein
MKLIEKFFRMLLFGLGDKIMPIYNTYIGDCIHCGCSAYFNEEEGWIKFSDGGWICDHELEEIKEETDDERD